MLVTNNQNLSNGEDLGEVKINSDTTGVFFNLVSSAGFKPCTPIVPI
jgi:hypothetical protein